MKRVSLAAALCLAFGTAAAQQGDGTQFSTKINVWKPNKVEATPERIAALKAPPGFTVNAFATGLKNARIIAVAPSGDIYVSRRDQATCCYHFQVVALDTVLDVPLGADRDQVLTAMKGHVLAKGEIVGKYAQRQQKQTSAGYRCNPAPGSQHVVPA